MATAISTTYLELMQRILTINEDGENRQHLNLDVKHVDMYYGQDLGAEGGIRTDTLPFMLRAVLIEFEPLDFRSIGRHKQRAEQVRISLHILSQCRLETSNITPGYQRNLALEHLAFIDSITYRLTGWAGSCTTSLSRTSLRPFETNGVVMKHILTFECAIEDEAAMRIPVSIGRPELDLTTTPQPQPAP